MNHDPLSSLLDRTGDTDVSETFQQQVLDRVHRHARLRHSLRHSLILTACAAAAFFMGRRLSDLQESGRPPSPRVVSAGKGVHWLTSTQSENGSWSNPAAPNHQRFTRGITSLATLALLKSPAYVPPDQLRQAVDYLTSELEASPAFSPEGPDFYNDILSLYVLQEANRLSPDPERTRLLHHRLHQLIQAQHPNGGWGYLSASPYAYRESTTPNSAVTWWAIQLLSRSDALPGKENALAQASSWLDQRFKTTGAPEYRAEGPFPAISREALTWMAGAFTHEPPSESAADPLPDAYRDFLRSRVEQTDDFLAGLREFQNQDGGWEVPEDRWWKAGGPVYVTACRILAQVPGDGGLKSF